MLYSVLLRGGGGWTVVSAIGLSVVQNTPDLFSTLYKLCICVTLFVFVRNKMMMIMLMTLVKGCTDVWATRHLGDRRLGDKNVALRLKQAQRRGSCKRLSVFSCFVSHLSKVHRRSNTDWQRLKRLWSRLPRRKPLPRTDIHSGPNVQLLSPKRSTCLPQMVI